MTRLAALRARRDSPFAGPPVVRPGPQARVVGRPRIVAVIGWGLMVLLGVVPVASAPHDLFALIIGSLVMFIGLAGMATTLRYRVWIDGKHIIARIRWNWFESIRLDKLTLASVSGQASPGRSRAMVLMDSSGAELRLQPLLLVLTRLYAELGAYIDPDDSRVDGEMDRMIREHAGSND